MEPHQHPRSRNTASRQLWQPRRSLSSLPPPSLSPEHTLDPENVSLSPALDSPSRLRPRGPPGRTRWQRRSVHIADKSPSSEVVCGNLDSQEIATAACSAKIAIIEEEAASQHSKTGVASSSYLVSDVDSSEEVTREPDPQEASFQQNSKGSVMGGKLPEITSQHQVLQEITASADFSKEIMKEATPLDITSQNLQPLEIKAFVDTEEDDHLKLQQSSHSVYHSEKDGDRLQLHSEKYPATSSHPLGCLENAVSEAIPSENISQQSKSQDIIDSIDLLKLQETTLSVDSFDGARDVAFEHNSCKMQSCETRTDEVASAHLNLSVTGSIESAKESLPSNELSESNADSSEEGKRETAAPQLSESEEFTAFVKVDAPFLKFMTGKRGETKQRIENETTTNIYVPSPHEVKQGASIVIKGQSQEKVDNAVIKLQAVFHEAEESSILGYSHFISLPLALHPPLKEQIIRFHDSVLSLVAGEKMQPSEPCESLDNANKGSERNIPIVSTDDVVDASEEADPTETICADDFETKAVDNTRKEMERNVSDPTEAICSDDFEPKAKEETSVLSEDENEDPNIDLEISSSGATETNKFPASSTESAVEVQDDENVPLKAKRDHRIEESIFIRPTRLHLTVLMLKLWNKERVAAAAEVLQNVKPKVLDCLDHRPIFVRLKGLECMKGSPKKAHVLYINVEETEEKNRLTQACNIIRDAFVEAGLVSQKEKDHELKLHATLMNSMHRTRRKGKRHSKRIPFDAREILQKHGSEDWGESMIVEAHLSERFAYDEDDYYHCCGRIKFPPVNTPAI